MTETEAKRWVANGVGGLVILAVLVFALQSEAKSRKEEIAALESGKHVGEALGERQAERAYRTDTLPVLRAKTGTGRVRLPSVAGRRYAEARKALIASGWSPERRPRGELEAMNSPIYGNAEAVIRHGFDEIVSCAGSGDANCAFAFKTRRGDRLVVVTAGEADGDDLSPMVVEGVRLTPAEEPKPHKRR